VTPFFTMAMMLGRACRRQN